MKKSLIALAVLGATSSFAMAASNVTLYGRMDTGVVAGDAKHADSTIDMKSGFRTGSRWGIKGTEDLGNGYQVGFILEQGFDSDNGNASEADRQFRRESILSVKGDFGSLAFGRTGALGFAQSQAILTGWAFGTSWGNGAWTSIGKSFSRMDNVISYATPKMGGFTVHAMYSNGLDDDATAKTTDGSAKWSENNHYYGVGVKYQDGAIKSSLIFEMADNKGKKDAAAENQYIINYGLEYNLGDWTPMFAYQYNWQDGGDKNHIVGLSAKAKAAGGTVMFGARYLFGENDGVEAGEDKQRAWTVSAAYEYPLSKRTTLWAYGGYADGSKLYDADFKKEGAYVNNNVNKNGYQVGFGLSHNF